GAGRSAGSARTVRREGSRSGAAPAGDTGGGQRRLRRHRRADRRSADHAREDPQGARRQGRGQADALRTVPFPPHRVAGNAAGAAALGRRRRKSHPEERDRPGMMRLPYFRYHAPRTVAEAAELLANGDAMLMAGGTDLLPNMKRRQQVPRTLIGLRSVAELNEMRNGSGLTIGAGVTLTALLRDARVRDAYRGLWQAARQVATPQLRNMGTIGGNVCLDTRCNYYDQNYEWRKAIDFCMKKDGETCWVATSSPKCLAVSSTDTAPALMSLGASVTLTSAAGTRRL